MRSLGIDIDQWIKSGKLRYIATRPTFYSLEMHLAVMLREVTRFDPGLVILDPISSFLESGDRMEIQSMLLRVVDFLKGRGVTAVFTHLMHGQDSVVQTDAGLSSIMDAWILLLNREVNGEFNRELYLLKARGLSHSNQVREFVMSDDGIKLVPPYLGENGALTGSARKNEEAKSRQAEMRRNADMSRAQQQIQQKRRRAKAQMEALQAELDADEIELNAMMRNEDDYRRQTADDRIEMERSRKS
jgi:circadian clock protein KaiC